MNIIKHNPFRVLGIVGNATEKELQKQISIIKRYAEIGKIKSFDYDFIFLGDIPRTLKDVHQASSRIEQTDKKLLYSLFWFVNNNHFDEIAFSNLKERDIDKAIEIWNRTLKNKITSRNYSSYHNLSTLYIALSTIDDYIELDQLKTGISLKRSLIYSENLEDFSKFVTGNRIPNDPIDICKKFVDEIVGLLKPYLNNNRLSIKGLLSLFGTFPENIQKYISSKFTEIPISNIETNIEKTIKKRKENPSEADEYGKELYKSTKADLKSLKNIIGSSNVQFQIIANKLANEILQCSIDFFNNHRREISGYDPGDNAIIITKYAKSIGATGHTKNRINETMSCIQEWVDDKPYRERQEVVAEEITFITDKLQGFQNLTNSIENALDLVVSCKQKLSSIKNELGNHDDFYLGLSSAVVAYAQDMLVTTVNKAQDDLSGNRHKIEQILREALKVSNLLGSMDMNPKLREQYDRNHSTLKSIIIRLMLDRGITNRSSSDGCYIATMAYGDYNHPQVMILRKFRDETLLNTVFGRSFVSFYYVISPYLVKLLKNQKYLNQLIRNLLDKFVNKVK